MKKKFLVFIMFMGIVISADALSGMYYSSFGVRFGKFNSGISYKHFYDTDNSRGIQVDAYITHMADGGYTLKGFYLKQVPFKLPILHLPLDLILGGGLHAGYFPKDNLGYYKIRHGDPVYYGKNTISGGIDGTVQIEYQVSKKVAPFTITIDCVPFYEFYNEGPEHIDFGVSLRYTFR